MRILVLCFLVACGSKSEKDKPQPKPQPSGDAAVVKTELPPAPPLPPVPAGLPPAPEHPRVTAEAVALGELLFWDTRLSAKNNMSCAWCHKPADNFSGEGQDANALGKPNLRRAPTLVNMAWQKEFGWDGRYASLAEHLAAHVKGQLGDDLAASIARIDEVPGYREHFARVGEDAAMTALSAYVLTRYAGDAPWDKLERSPDVPADVKAGYAVFIAKAQCSVCHTPPLYTDHQYHRLGLIKTPDEGRGLRDPAQKGAFKTPTLRGAALRRGFFHDGSAETLEDAIDYHLAGGIGQGADPSIIDPALKKITLTAAERTNLIAFVRALTDDKPVAEKPALP